MDIGKLHEAAMFYLPSKRPGCFLMHVRDGRMPLDPPKWVNLIPDHLLFSPTPPVPSDIPQHEETPRHHGYEWVQWAIDYWRKVGCVKGKGRTQFWLLAKRLAEAGCNDPTMKDILNEQAGHATNAEERRSEKDALFTDPQVIAAKWQVTA